MRSIWARNRFSSCSDCSDDSVAWCQSSVSGALNVDVQRIVGGGAGDDDLTPDGFRLIVVADDEFRRAERYGGGSSQGDEVGSDFAGSE